MAKVSLATLLELLVACTPAPAAVPTPPTGAVADAGIRTCSHERLVFLVDQFFARDNERDLAGFLALFNFMRSSGGFDYYDNDGEPHQLLDRLPLAEYVRVRWALDDRFPAFMPTYPAEGSSGNAVGNPTVAFTRSVSGAPQTGNAKLVCNEGLLVGVVMTSVPQ